MKGLLLKDFYTLTKQMKIFLLFIVIFSVMPGYNMASFAIIYSAMLPFTALAYDERSKWNSLAAMMPYSTSNLVLSKYVLGYIAVLCATILSFIAQTIIAVINKSPIEPQFYISMVIMICMALIMQSINLPFMFKLGVEKGRLLLFALIGIVVFIIMFLGNSLALIAKLKNINLTIVIIVCIISTIIINVLSILISIKVYKSKEK